MPPFRHLLPDGDVPAVQGDPEGVHAEVGEHAVGVGVDEEVGEVDAVAVADHLSGPVKDRGMELLRGMRLGALAGGLVGLLAGSGDEGGGEGDAQEPAGGPVPGAGAAIKEPLSSCAAGVKRPGHRGRGDMAEPLIVEVFISLDTGDPRGSVGSVSFHAQCSARVRRARLVAIYARRRGLRSP